MEAELLINQQQVAELTRHNKELQVQVKDRETDFHQNEVNLHAEITIKRIFSAYSERSE